MVDCVSIKLNPIPFLPPRGYGWGIIWMPSIMSIANSWHRWPWQPWCNNPNPTRRVSLPLNGKRFWRKMNIWAKIMTTMIPRFIVDVTKVQHEPSTSELVLYQQRTNQPTTTTNEFMAHALKSVMNVFHVFQSYIVCVYVCLKPCVLVFQQQKEYARISPCNRTTKMQAFCVTFPHPPCQWRVSSSKYSSSETTQRQAKKDTWSEVIRFLLFANNDTKQTEAPKANTNHPLFARLEPGTSTRAPHC